MTTDTMERTGICFVVVGSSDEPARVVLHGSLRTIATCDKLPEAELIADLLNEAVCDG